MCEIQSPSLKTTLLRQGPGRGALTIEFFDTMSLTHKDDASKCVVVLRSNSLGLAAFPAAEEVPRHDVEEDGRQDGGRVPDRRQTDALVRTRSLLKIRKKLSPKETKAGNSGFLSLVILRKSSEYHRNLNCK